MDSQQDYTESPSLSHRRIVMPITQDLFLILSISALCELSIGLDMLNFDQRNGITSVSFLGMFRNVNVGSMLSLN